MPDSKAPILLNLTPELKTRLQKSARAENRSLTNFIVWALEEFLEDRQESDGKIHLE